MLAMLKGISAACLLRTLCALLCVYQRESERERASKKCHFLFEFSTFPSLHRAFLAPLSLSTVP